MRPPRQFAAVLPALYAHRLGRAYGPDSSGTALTAASIAPGCPSRDRWRRRLERAGHNVLMAMHASTIAYQG